MNRILASNNKQQFKIDLLLNFSCVLAGACGGAYCAENARCELDHLEQISYCQCLEGYHGDGVRECVYVPPPCNVVNNCGLNAACAPDYR